MTVFVKKLVLSAMFLSLGLLLPFLTAQIPEIGKALLPMHIPVILCGFICGWQYGLAVGFITPLLRSVIFGMPVLYPMAFAMAFELAAYGFMCGLLYQLLPKKKLCVYPALPISMIAGRLVYGGVMLVLSGLSESIQYSFGAFLSGTVLTAIPGIILQLVLIPAIMIALESAHLVPVRGLQQQP